MEEITFVQFQVLYNKYPVLLFPLFSLYRDITLKNELDQIEILDGFEIFKISSFLLVGLCRANGRQRVIIPILLDSKIDLEWFGISLDFIPPRSIIYLFSSF